jgi:hypothetical protein
VGNLDKVVKLSAAANLGAAERCPVYSRICTDFHIVSDFHVACLRDFLESVGRRSETETVGPDHRA